jgi:DNA polymerase elongation subunit (family B)
MDLVSLIGKSMGCSGCLKTEVALDERHLLLRIASVVRWKDPDALISWDTQGGGLGYLIERGLALGDKDSNQTNGSLIDMVRLFGRTPKYDKAKTENTYKGLFDIEMNEESKSEKTSERWKGSTLGAEWVRYV